MIEAGGEGADSALDFDADVADLAEAFKVEVPDDSKEAPVGSEAGEALGTSDAGISAAELGVNGFEASMDPPFLADLPWSGAELHNAADELQSTRESENVAIYNSRGEVGATVSASEARIYEGVGLEPREVAGREVLVRSDIDWSASVDGGRTNLERAEAGLAPLDPTGKPYELHHVQQLDHGLLAELTQDEHGGENSQILHDRPGPSEIDREAFAEQRAAHWIARAAEIRGGGEA